MRMSGFHKARLAILKSAYLCLFLPFLLVGDPVLRLACRTTSIRVESLRSHLHKIGGRHPLLLASVPCRQCTIGDFLNFSLPKQSVKLMAILMAS